MRTERHTIEHSAHIRASAESVWHEVVQVDITSFRHPAWFSISGIPKPLRAELLQPGVGGARIALFSNNRQFSQEITEWCPSERYAFTFKADPRFRVAYILDLSNGPFHMIAGAYRISETESGSLLSLSSEYELLGTVGVCLRVPVRLVLNRFQAYLLRGIRANSERRAVIPN